MYSILKLALLTAVAAINGVALAAALGLPYHLARRWQGWPSLSMFDFLVLSSGLLAAAIVMAIFLPSNRFDWFGRVYFAASWPTRLLRIVLLAVRAIPFMRGVANTALAGLSLVENLIFAMLSALAPKDSNHDSRVA